MLSQLFFFNHLLEVSLLHYFFPIPSNPSGQSRNLHNFPFLAEEIEAQRG